jgi:hypothetical protein
VLIDSGIRAAEKSVQTPEANPLKSTKAEILPRKLSTEKKPAFFSWFAFLVLILLLTLIGRAIH